MERKRRKVRFRVQVRQYERRILRPVYATIEIDRVTGEVAVRELHSRIVARCSLGELAEHALHLDAVARAREQQREREVRRALQMNCGGER